MADERIINNIVESLKKQDQYFKDGFTLSKLSDKALRQLVEVVVLLFENNMEYDDENLKKAFLFKYGITV